MESRTSANFCEVVLFANTPSCVYLMIMFSFLVAMFSYPAVFLTSLACFVDGAFHRSAADAGVFDTWNAFHTRASTACSFLGRSFRQRVL
jgi:hypothetical protein